MSVASMANTNAQVMRATTPVGDFGSVVRDRGQVGTLTLRISPLSGMERTFAGREVQDATHKGYVEGASDVTFKDQLKHTDALGEHTLDVESVYPRTLPGGRIHHTELLLRETQ